MGLISVLFQFQPDFLLLSADERFALSGMACVFQSSTNGTTTLTLALWRLLAMSLAVVLCFFSQLSHCHQLLLYSLANPFCVAQYIDCLNNQSHRTHLGKKTHLLVACSNTFAHLKFGSKGTSLSRHNISLLILAL